MANNIVYIAIHRATHADGDYPDYFDNMLGCFFTLDDAKKRIMTYINGRGYPAKFTELTDLGVCDAYCNRFGCEEIYAIGYDYVNSGERCSIYKCQIR